MDNGLVKRLFKPFYPCPEIISIAYLRFHLSYFDLLVFFFLFTVLLDFFTT